MARSITDKDLVSRSARLKLRTRHDPHWVAIAEALALGYRRAARGSGKWQARQRTDGKYNYMTLGKADDYEDANGETVLTFYQAQEQARTLSWEAAKSERGAGLKPYTVAEAAADYMEWFEAHRKSKGQTWDTINAHVLPPFSDVAVRDLTPRQLRRWLTKLTDGRKPATANRILNVLKAILNHAWREGLVESDSAWRRVQPFHNVSKAKIRYLTVTEANRLVNSSASDFQLLVRAALLTGTRYGELCELRVGDYNEDGGTLYIADSKSGKPRHIPLTEEGEEFFEETTAGRKNSQHMLLRADGEPWGKSHQKRPIDEACARAKIEPRISFHVLRHTYASLLAMEGVPMQVIAAALGHSDTRITEKHYAHLQPSFVADTIRAKLPRYTKRRSKVTRLRRRNG